MRMAIPSIREEDKILTSRLVEIEGHYDCELNLETLEVTVWFTFFHLGEFKSPIQIYKKVHPTLDEASRFFHDLRWKYSIKYFFNFEDRYLTPIRDRDKRIQDLNHSARHKVYRQRNYKKFYVMMAFTKEWCDAWACQHVHETRIWVRDALTHSVVHEETYDCDHVWEGVQRYHFILNEFDMFYMEMHL